uniref:NAD-dependent epimerase/dehydratase domain-containing protein n=1 Tax=Globisporangium ultimum (strain ATCC 200006 / CBS 805.95 / DAOM BR144) TaxID=431595 RepID=K3WRG6_GLOUD
MDNSSDHSIPDSPRSPSSSAPLIASTTGGAGFIGFHTCVALLERGDSVVVVDELNDYYDVKLKHSLDRVKIYIGDLCDQALVCRVIQDTRSEAIIY